MGSVLYFKTVSLGRECSAIEEHRPNMSEALRSIFSTIVMKRRRRRCSGSTSRRKYTLIFKLSRVHLKKWSQSVALELSERGRAVRGVLQMEAWQPEYF